MSLKRTPPHRGPPNMCCSQRMLSCGRRHIRPYFRHVTEAAKSCEASFFTA